MLQATRSEVPPRMRRAALLVILLCCSSILFAADEPPATNVILVTLDGFRWQELFGGADANLLLAEKAPIARDRFHRETPEERRKLLMPFFWSEIAVKGQVFGAPEANSAVYVTNPMHFSYPGYQEILCGFPDPKFDSNDKIQNPNTTVFEWLNNKPAFAGKVAAFATWDVFPFIFNAKRCGFPVQACWEPFEVATTPQALEKLNAWSSALPRYWPGNCFDAVTCEGALEYLRTRKPRVMYIGLGETDEWAHAGRYGLYLESAQKSDAFLKRLWTELESMPEYAGKTALLITSDHGRGNGREWTSHKYTIEGSDRIWIAAMGAGVKAEGLRRVERATQSQVAATLAALLGEDYKKEIPQAGEALPGLR